MQAGPDIDYLAVRLHGRRSRLAERRRLDELCQLGSIAELARELGLGASTVQDMQRSFTRGLAAELYDIAQSMSGRSRRLLHWMAMRYHLENLKVDLRGVLSRMPSAQARAHLIELPAALTVELAESVATLPEAALGLRGSPFAHVLREAVARYEAEPQPLLLEAALDQGYLRELVARLDRLPAADREWITDMVAQEVDIYHLALVVRGKFHYGHGADTLSALHVAGSSVSYRRFRAMLGDSDLGSALARASGRMWDSGGLAAARAADSPGRGLAVAVEGLAWARYLNLANRAFRRSHVGLGAVAGYAGIRRIEVANLITLSEGIAASMSRTDLRERLISRDDREEAHV